MTQQEDFAALCQADDERNKPKLIIPSKENATRNRLANMHNPYQGKSKKVLCVCSAGLLRSPSAAYVLSNEPFNYNTRACGVTTEFALIPVDEVLLKWADEIVCMEEAHKRRIPEEFHPKVLVLDIEDRYNYRDPDLLAEIAASYEREAARKSG